MSDSIRKSELIDWLRGKKYTTVDETSDIMSEDFENKHRWELSRNCFINDTIKHIQEQPTIEALIIPEGGIGELSDGFHTFNELYHHRAVLFSVICNLLPQNAWKSKLHDTGDMYDGMFIVGINTAEGQATYHYDIDPYWEMFKVKELPRAPKWDGHTPDEAIRRIGSIKAEPVVHGRWLPTKDRNKKECSNCGVIHLIAQYPHGQANYCPNCGAKMKAGDQNE